MKRILLFIIFFYFGYFSFAQIPFGTPVNFCSLDGTVYNPGCHNEITDDKWVVTRTDEEWSQDEKLFLNRSFMDDYPGHIILDGPTVSYNCHGYSFGIVQGTDRYNISWFEELCDDAFVLVSTPQKGDIAVIRDYEDNLHTIFKPESLHSSVVVNQDTLISKWGDGALTKHHKFDVIDIPSLASGGSVYTYYRRVTNTQITGPDVIDGSGTYTFIPNATPSSCTWSVEPKRLFRLERSLSWMA